MKNNERSSNEQREFIDSIYEEINDMFVCQESGYREIFSEEEVKDVGMRIIEE